MIKKYGKYFWILPLIFSIRESYQILYGTLGDIPDLLMFIGFTYYFWGMSVGKFKWKKETRDMNKILTKIRGLKNIPKLIILYISFSFILFIIGFLIQGRIISNDITFIEPLSIVLSPENTFISLIILFLYWIFYGSLYRLEYLEIVRQEEEEKKGKKREINIDEKNESIRKIRSFSQLNKEGKKKELEEKKTLKED